MTDHYVEDERSVVMVDESVLGLSPIATTILEAVPDGSTVTLQAVTEHVVRTFGPPDDPNSAEDLTRQQVWDLAAHKVLLVVGDELSFSERRAGELAGEERSEGVTALRSALRHLRAGTAGTWVLPERVGPTSLVAAARAHHVVPSIAANLDRLALPRQASSELEAMAGRQRAGAKQLAADLVVVSDALAAERIPVLAFKGVTLAAQAYGDFAIRGAGDLDVLVPPQDVDRAHGVLNEAGWTPAPGFPIPGHSWAWRHHLQTGNELTLIGPRSNVDLHWHLVPMRGAFPDFDALWRRRTIVSVDGHPIPTLSPYDALAHSSGHAARDRWRWLRSLLDVHVLASDPNTWHGADRPLRPEQLLSIGLAVTEFGMPSAAPPIVHLAMQRVDPGLRRRVLHEQDGTTPQHQPLSVPGINFVRRLRELDPTPSSIAEARRLLSESLLPSRFTTHELSPHAIVAVPRVLGNRAAEVVSRLSDRQDSGRDR
ncbi:nucleotidyltransferase domain-containing protein [Nocardioides pinisoli]|uniref:Nucleotidyltransferase family protein n=1 Tax=Nocardioides pinisoli TaxID=2950279 RepID=A0ABT1KTD4_9ACTN|nr:nucleotidyltransferase family protein [Nocardioides pinisoli]MCP3420912.1 nucleotidyltransferase family protein [Nocardioides pinisoli]